jgi:hypothetical protein
LTQRPLSRADSSSRKFRRLLKALGAVSFDDDFALAKALANYTDGSKYSARSLARGAGYQFFGIDDVRAATDLADNRYLGLGVHLRTEHKIDWGRLSRFRPSVAARRTIIVISGGRRLQLPTYAWSVEVADFDSGPKYPQLPQTKRTSQESLMGLPLTLFGSQWFGYRALVRSLPHSGHFEFMQPLRFSAIHRSAICNITKFCESLVKAFKGRTCPVPSALVRRDPGKQISLCGRRASAKS